MSEERNSNDVEDKISIKEIHETFWRCRDFELSLKSATIIQYTIKGRFMNR